MPLVSVIVPAWNAEQFLACAISSALAQTMADLELLVVDDASTDGTAAIAAAAAAADPRVRLLRAPQNAGPSAARNRALDHAQGRYVAVLDADDRFAPVRLQSMVGFMQVRHADIAFDNLLRCPNPRDDEGGEPHLSIPADAGPRRLDLEGFLMGNRMNGSDRTLGHLKPIISRAFLEKARLRYDPQIRIAEDFMLIAEALALGASAWLLPDAGYKYWLRPGSLSKRPMARDIALLQACDDGFRARHGAALAPGARRALDARRADLDGMQAFLRCREAALAGRWLSAAAAIARRPAALVHAQPGLKDRGRAALRQLRRAFAR